MADSVSQLSSILLNKENTFTVSFQEFQKFFPLTWRNHDQVKILFEVIQERLKNSKKRVKENIKDFLKQVHEEEQCADFDDLIRALTQLEHYLQKDIAMFESDIEAVHDHIMQYVSYLQVRSEEILEESEICSLDDSDKKELDSLIAVVKFPS